MSITTIQAGRCYLANGSGITIHILAKDSWEAMNKALTMIEEQFDER